MKTLTQHDELLVKPYIDSKIQTLTNQVKDMNNVYGSKNLLPIKYSKITNYGITWEKSNDGYIILNGTSTASPAQQSLFDETPATITSSTGTIISLKELGIDGTKKYIFSRDTKIVNVRPRIDLWSDSAKLAEIELSNNDGLYKEIDFSQYPTCTGIKATIQVTLNTTLTDAIQKIMLCLKSVYELDSTFAPYAKTNQQLTKDTTALLDNTEVNGAVNMLPCTHTDNVVDSVTLVVNDDGSLTLSGTSTRESGYGYFNGAFFTLPKGTYKISKTIENVGMYLANSGGKSVVTASDSEDKIFTLSDNTEVRLVIRVAAGLAVSGTIYPMITVPSYNGDYVPYAKSNKELTVRTDNKFRRTRKDITNYLDNLVTAIAAQDLESYGYSIGDYFVGASGYKYHLADMDTYYGSYASYAVLNTHHIGIVVQTGATAQWNTSDSTSTGYSGSNLHTYLTGTVLDNIKSDMIALFGGTTGLEHLLSHQKLLTNNVSAWAWVAGQYISALSEVQVYSSRVWGIDGYQTGEANKPLQIFQKFRFNEIFGSIWLWLRDIMSASYACDALPSGNANSGAASAAAGVVGLILFH